MRVIGASIGGSGIGGTPRVRRLLLAVVPLLLAGCQDETIVYRNRPLFADPPSEALGFLGYSDSTVKLTVCGNCHVGVQAEWELTAHADAWATLENSGHSQAICEGCHTVNQRGNMVVEVAGYSAAPDARYHDVQCESCHGPGLDHVLDPDAEQPIPSILADTGATSGCGECHSGTHHPFVDEWAQSPHAQVLSAPAGRAECQGCHIAQGALRAFGVTADYQEKDGAPLPLVCAVCHDPHGGVTDSTERIEGQLRFPVKTTSIEEHLCARCHNRRTVPDPNSSHGVEPHAPEAALLVGDAGWFPPGVTLDSIRGTHGSAKNERLCATCHVNRFEVTDKVTGDFVFQATGHLFEAIPCLDSQGIPTTGDCALTVTARAWKGCTGSGCHGDPTAARSALIAAATDVRDKANTLLELLETVDPNLEASGGEIDGNDPRFTVAEGAFFNYNLAVHGGGEGSGRPDTLLTVAPSTVHNPFLMRALLSASIQAVQDQYGLRVADAPRRAGL